jgi:hypothetical protein
MFCAACGKSVKQGVTYCTRCGARADGSPGHAASKLSEASFNTLIAGMMGIPIAGLGIVIGLMSVMKELGFGLPLIIVFTSVSFLLLLSAETVFILLLLQNRARADRESAADARLPKAEPRELAEAQPLELPDPLPSVTEEPTRAFAPIPRDPNLT